MFRKNSHYIKGSLRIRISGNSVERFINLCANKNIYLWELVPDNKSYYANILLHDFKKIKPIVRKTKTKVVITERIGFPFIMEKYRFRKIFFTGFFLCIFLIFYLSTIIWNISLHGNISYSDENIIKYLAENEIKIGTLKSEIDCFKLAGNIRKTYDNIIWVSVSINGSNLIINIKENLDFSSTSKDVVNHSNTGYDIISDKDCKITNMITRTGIPHVKEGDFVKKGDLLISGQIPVYNDQKEIIHYKSCNADGNIVGETIVDYEDHISLKYTSKSLLNTYKHEYFIKLGPWRFSLGEINNHYNKFQMNSTTHCINELSYGVRSVFPYKVIEKKYRTNEVRKILSNNFNYYCDELKKKGVVILQNNVKIYTWSDEAQASGTLIINMPVGQKRISTIKKIGDTIDGNDGNNN